MAFSLPDDVLLEILVRLKVDTATLFRCAIACRRWCGLVADPSFLHRCWPDDARPSFVGFFMKQRICHQGTDVLIRTPRSVLGRGRRALSSFVSDVSSDILHHAVPLVSRQGLLLVHLNLDRNWDQRFVHLAVCNLLAGTCHMLPPLMCTAIGWNDYYGCAVLPGDDCHSIDKDKLAPVEPSSSSLFKVVIITSNGNDVEFQRHMFSSDKTFWSSRTEYLGTRTANYYGWSFSRNDAVVHHRTSHWLYRNFTWQLFGVVSINALSSDVSLTRLPFSTSDDVVWPCLTLATDNTLSVLRMRTSGSQLDIWTRPDYQQSVDNTSYWLCTQTIKLIQLNKQVTRGSRAYILGEKCGQLIVNYGHHRHVYTTDLQTGTVEEVPDWPRIRPIRILDVVPLEIDWPAFFISRLGTVSVRGSMLPRSSPSNKTASRRRRQRRGKGGRQRRGGGCGNTTEAADEGAAVLPQ